MKSVGVPMRVCASTSASVFWMWFLLPSPCDRVDEAEDEVDDPWMERLIQNSEFCRL